MSFQKSLGAFLLLTALCLTGCGKKTSEVLDEVRPKLEPLRARLRQIAAELPPPSPLPRDTISAAPSPKPILREDGEGNLAFFHASELTNPNATIDERKDVRLSLGGNLIALLNWTAQPSSLSSLDSRSGSKEFAERMEAIRARARYLGVYRIAEYDPPVATDEKTFQGGRATVEFFVYDLNDGKLLAQWRLTARPNQTVEYRYRQGEDQKKALEGWAYSSIYENLRKALYESLPARIGGEYQNRK